MDRERKTENQRGFTLVEVIASAAILGVGIMGMAAMQGMAFNKNVDARDLSTVTNIAADMMERIQANRYYAWSYHSLATTGPGNCAALPNTANRPSEVTKPLLHATIAVVQGDCTQWRTLVLASNLSNVSGTVTVVNGGPTHPTMKIPGTRQVVVQLQWNDRGPGQRLRTVNFQTALIPE